MFSTSTENTPRVQILKRSKKHPRSVSEHCSSSKTECIFLLISICRQEISIPQQYNYKAQRINNRGHYYLTVF